MLGWALAFFIVTIITAVLGFRNALGTQGAPHIEQVCRDVVVYTGGSGAPEIAKILFVVFLVLFLVSLVAGLLRRP